MSLLSLSELSGLRRTGWRPPEEFPSLRGATRICVDVETKDPDLLELGPGFRRGGYVVGLAVAVDGGPRWYFPTRHEGGGNLDLAQVSSWFRAEAAAFEGEVVGAHVLYDLEALALDWNVFFLRAKGFRDVLIAEPLLDENQEKFDLDSAMIRRLGRGKEMTALREVAGAIGWKTDAAIKKNLWRLPADRVGAYAEEDAAGPLDLLRAQEPLLASEKLLRLFELECRLTPMLLAMRLRGVRADREGAIRARERLGAERDACAAEVRRLAGPRASLTDPQSIADALEEAGIELPRTQKTGARSVTTPFLKKFENSIPLVKAYLRGKKLQTTIGTFIDGHVLSNSKSGRIYAEFPQLKGDDGGTIARFASRNPNLQNITARDEELAPLLRGLFLPDEGEDWCKHDLSQIQYRYLVHFAVGPGAEEARDLYRRAPETDYHGFAGDMFGADASDKFVRKRVKNTNFAKVFGGGVDKLAETFGCSFEEAAEFDAVYDERLPFVSATLRSWSNEAQRKGYVRTILGRRRRFPLWERRGKAQKGHERHGLPREDAVAAWGERNIQRFFTHAALCAGLQGSEADHVKRALVHCSEAGLFAPSALGAPLILVHDEDDLSKPRTKEGDEAAAEVQRIMEHCMDDRISIPVRVDSAVGANWGECL